MAQGGGEMTGYRWDYVLIDTASLWLLAFDWWCFQVMRRWGRDVEETRWVYFNATAEEWRQSDEDHRGS